MEIFIKKSFKSKQPHFMRNQAKFLMLIMTILSCSAFAQDTPTPRPEKKKHIFALVHGAWHGSWSWYKIETLLIDSAQKVVNINLPGHGIDTTDTRTITMQSYCDKVSAEIDSITKDNEKVILVGHSMGGAVISQVAEQKHDKIEKLVYVAAFLLQNGQTVFGMASTDENSLVNPLEPNFTNMTLPIKTSPRDVKKVFYGGAKKFDVRLSSSLLTPNPLLPLQDTLSISDEKYGQIPRFYIKTTRDSAITPEQQQQMIDSMPCQHVYTLNAAHSPFYTRPFKLTEMLLSIARDTVHVLPENQTLQTAPSKQATKKRMKAIRIYASGNQIHFSDIPENWEKSTVSLYTINGKRLFFKRMYMKNHSAINIDNINDKIIIVKIQNAMNTTIEKKLLLK